MIGEYNTADALDVAIQVLTQRATETDTASPEGHAVRCALETIQMIRDQRGCEHLGKVTGGRCRESGKLVELIDVIVFG